MQKDKALDRWNIDKSAELYGIHDWGAGYFDISSKGEVVVVPPFGDTRVTVSLMDVVSGIRDRGMDMPVLLRFENLLDAQIRNLNESFHRSIKRNEYRGEYRGVFPIKVNQQQQVIEEIARFGERYSHGFEAGSKAELIAALAMVNEKDSLVICNGYKDEEFIDLGLNAIKMGHKCFFVLEMPGELALIIERANKLKVRPLIGVRLKLSSRANGHWTDSGGDRSIFGLTTTQLIDVVDTLKKNDLLDCLKLLHYHLGSQIPNIRDIRSAVVEACRYYVDLVKEGAPMGYMDMGGGLAVDYDGSQTNFVHSRNYTLDEYTTDIIEVIKGVLDEDDIPHPTVVTESGRALVAYHSVLLFNILDVNRFEPLALPDRVPPDSNEFMLNLQEVLDSLSMKNLQECYNDALYYREEIRELFKHGTIALRERSLGENLFLKIMREINRLAKKTKKAPADLEDLQVALSDIYYCNFSVFQSLPDAWAIDQIFPIIPLHRLKEEPTREGILADITCDCDGKIDRFVDIHDVKLTLPLHDPKENEEYYLGVFLVGAYQETLGDLHNLLGDTNVVSIRIHESGQYDFVREIEGDSIADVLSYVEYNPKELQALFRAKAERAVRSGLITATERKRIVNNYEESLRGYTYYER